MDPAAEAHPRSENDPRTPGRAIRRHVLASLPGPTLVLLAVLTLLVVTQDLLSFSDLVLNRGLPASVTAAITLDRAVPSVAWMIPFAVLLGGLVALGRLAGDGELFLLQTSGVSLLAIWRPFAVFGALMALLCALLSIVASPAANRRLDARLDSLARTHPWSHLQAGFVHRFGEFKLSAREISEDGQELHSVQLYMPSLGDTLFAEVARMTSDETGEIEIQMEHARSLPRPEEGEPSGRVIDAKLMETTLPSSDEQMSRPEADRLSGLAASVLRERGDLESLLTLHRRMTWPVLTLLFALATVPLFVRGARFSGAMGMVVGILVLAIYQGLIQVGNGLVWSGSVAPAVGAWLPVGVVGLLTCLLPLGLKRRPTFGPRPEPTRLAVWLQSLRPSRARRGGRFALDRYVARSFFEMFLLCFLGILVAYVAIDVLDRVDRFVRYAPSLGEIGRYYAARLPLLASRVIPIALLVGTAITVALVGSRGELVGMRSCGVPAWRGLLPILLLSAIAVPTSFLLNDRVIPHSTALADRINDLIKGRSTGAERTGAWFREGDRFYEAELFDPEAGIARALTVFELDEAGLPVRRIDATSARHMGDGMWNLENGQRVDAGGPTAKIEPTDPVTHLGGGVDLELDTRHLSVSQIREEIELLEANGVDATRFHVDLWTKLATPLACLLLPMLALFFALVGPPHPSTAASLVFSVAVALSYTLLTGLSASLGYGGSLPPPAAAFAPALVFVVAAGVMGHRLHIFR